MSTQAGANTVVVVACRPRGEEQAYNAVNKQTSRKQSRFSTDMFDVCMVGDVLSQLAHLLRFII